MGIEFELKFKATPTVQQMIRQAYLLEHRSLRMETTYYDTPGSALSERRITLRKRMEDRQSVCTVKTPISGYGRGEWECHCEQIEEAIPVLCGLGAPELLLSLTEEGVVPVCGARFQRLAGTLTYADAVLELALDRGVLLGGGRERPLCEVEVELKSGAPETAVAFAMALAAQFGLEKEPESKFRRALALAKGE